MNVRRIPQLKKIVVGLAVLLWASSTLAVTGLENWENGLGDYYPDNGVWQVGTPTSGPGKAHQGVSVAGTILAGNYPGYQDSRLISPVIVLPAVQGKERVQLRFWHWFSYSTYDSGTVQISAYDVEADQWEDWTSLVSVYQVSAVWSPMYVDLTAYAGRYVRIAFAHTAQRDAHGHPSESSGWYIDEVRIWKGTPLIPNPEGFELGWGDSYTYNGVWEVGEPNSGPGAAYRGKAVAGTVLDGDYPAYTDSRLIIPPFLLPELPGLSPIETLDLRFWHWFSYSAYDSGTVQASAYDPATGLWRDWDDLARFTGVSGVWTPRIVPLTEYAGRYVRIAFVHTAQRDAHGHPSESSGWYIDEVQIPTGGEVVVYDVPLDSDPGWEMEGQWEYGVPTGQGGEDHGHPDPTSGSTGQHVLGVNLNGDYRVASGDRYALTAGPFDLSGYKDVAIEFARYLNTDEPDYIEDTVEVSIDGKQSWYPVWQHTDPSSITDSSWTPVRHALGAATDNQPTVYIRWSYQILDARAYECSGWNIDDIQLVGTPQ